MGTRSFDLVDYKVAEAEFFLEQGIPTTFVLDREGRIVKTYLGARPMIVFEADIKPMLNKP